MASVRNSECLTALNVYVDACDTGGTAHIVIYAGAVPAGPEAPQVGATTLVTLTMSATAFGAAADTNPGAAATAAAITPATAVAGDTNPPTYARIIDGGGTARYQMTAGVLAGELQLSGLIVAGATVSIPSLVATLPEAA